MPPPRPPSVDAILRAVATDIEGRDRAAMTSMARTIVAGERVAIARGRSPRSIGELAEVFNAHLSWLENPLSELGFHPVINATGVLLHTNLGRAPWPWAATQAALTAASRPSMLELDYETGRRGRRFPTVEDEIVALTGAEAALVTNNNAAALALAVSLAGRGGVALSRGEAVEIGGGVRIPEIVRRAGARLVEVGTTNRTRVGDFEAVFTDATANVVLRVHPSNFAQTGFVESPDPALLAQAAHRHGAIVIDDLGSGALLDTAEFGLAHEPTPGERIAAGVDLVTFSGDKLVGGPQAGVIAGRRELVDRLRKHPLARAMRPDKVILAALGATLHLYRAGSARTEIPIWRQIAAPLDVLERRGRAIADSLADDLVTVAPTESTVGGGSLPGQTLPSWALVIRGPSPQRLLASLRAGRPGAGEPGVIGRVVDDAVALDLRTVDPDDDDALAEAIRAALAR